LKRGRGQKWSLINKLNKLGESTHRKEGVGTAEKNGGGSPRKCLLSERMSGLPKSIESDFGSEGILKIEGELLQLSSRENKPLYK